VRRFPVIRLKNLKDLSELTHIENPYFIAGGTDLLIRIKDDFLPWPFTVIDISGLSELKGIDIEKDYIIIGALVTHGEIEKHKELNIYTPSLTQACSHVGSPQIRNRATIGGNIGNASPAGDSIPPLYVHGAEIHLVEGSEERWVKVEDFFKGPGKTVRKPLEIIKEIRIAREKVDFGTYARLGQRNALAISKVSMALSARKNNGHIEDIKIALGAVGPTVIMAKDTADFLKGKILSCDVIKEAGHIIEKEAKPISDLRSSLEYRKKMTSVLLEQSLEQFSE
jgi:CO/xanthine dehydrogenase FAD-binding subunit